MNIIKIKGVSDSYPEPVYGTNEWYFCKDSNNYFCDLYEAEEIVKSGEVFPGMVCHLIHYPEGTVYSPFERKENVYIERSIWDKGILYFLSVDFYKQIIQIYSYIPDNNRLEMIKELPLGMIYIFPNGMKTRNIMKML
ncbi:MAG: hypothetical protein LBQ71_19485 [Hungatella sp.]|jgi:hypothetical protein|nr:hypothetical protein [Hungatella sp.]